MEACRKAPPPLYQVAAQQAAACYLYEKQPVLAREQLSQVLPV
jgi:hypothetical protein